MSQAQQERPLIVAIGGGVRPGSSTELAMQTSLAAAQELGFETVLFGTEHLKRLPHYDPSQSEREPSEAELISAVRRAKGILIGTPSYHAGVSGMVKNAIDLLQETAKDERPYLEGIPVGLIVTAAGWQAGGVTLSALRGIVHALRGWPTPLGVTINTVGSPLFDSQGLCVDSALNAQLTMLGRQMVMGAHSSDETMQSGAKCAQA